jgi:hypothetical protein
MLGSARDGDKPAVLNQPGTSGAYVVTASPGALYERAKTAGAEIVVELRDTGRGGQRPRPATLRGARPREEPLVVRHVPGEPRETAGL